MATVASCSDRTIEPDVRCVATRIVPLDVDQITRTGRVLQFRLSGWDIGQLETDGSLTPIATFELDEPVGYASAWLEHDPETDRMWLLVGADEDLGRPTRLHQLDADGQLAWTRELTAERPVLGGSVLYHEDNLYLALTIDDVQPADPEDWESYIPYELVLERHDLEGNVLWTNSSLADEPSGFAFAGLIRVIGSTLAMVATPPYIDYGPSYPATVDIETGAVLWAGAEDGHDPLRVLADGESLYLAWNEVIDRDIPLSGSTLSVRAPSDGSELARSDVEWRPGASPGFGGANIALGWMGERLVSVVETEQLVDAVRSGVTVHEKDGTLVCQATLDAEFDSFSRGYSIDGREQFFVIVSRRIGDPDDYDYERVLLIIEPHADE